MIDPKSLRPGNWIHCKGSSHYGIVTGEILAKMERDEKFREKFEYIELTVEFLAAIGLKRSAGTCWIGNVECPAYELPVSFFSELMQDHKDRSLFHLEMIYFLGQK